MNRLSKEKDSALSSLTPCIGIAYGGDKGCVIPCRKDVCYELMYSPDKLREFLKKYLF